MLIDWANISCSRSWCLMIFGTQALNSAIIYLSFQFVQGNTLTLLLLLNFEWEFTFNGEKMTHGNCCIKKQCIKFFWGEKAWVSYILISVKYVLLPSVARRERKENLWSNIYRIWSRHFWNCSSTCLFPPLITQFSMKCWQNDK